MSDFSPAAVPTGIVEVNGKPYMADAKGALMPVELIKPQHLLEDETVRKIMGFALALSDQVKRFKEHTFEDLGAFDAILEQEYNLTKGGPKGNRTYQTHDGLMKIEVRVNDLMDFGPELQIGKALLDECLNDWASDSRPEIRALITKTFNTDKEGQVNRALLFTMLGLQVEDARWNRAMDAIREAIRVVGSKTYYRIQMRSAPDAPWTSVTIDLAKA
ncbi:uncharacterized protein DUF3164 [Rhodobacter aestuarii]|uniref:Sulfate transporter n=1 Tax=Rhodobacter aestuarii TaxID=453582 RepID=A0A1N7Q248_9RHOB|nr:DUF3164 family protein [Rhodobacter aestuarii]PTV94044.1 uncharacterized protein DUF3164 [Rhodobacter aestuarii]SIT16930.1 Protein of unknown function [Rhodobacter aestuarii]